MITNPKPTVTLTTQQNQELTNARIRLRCSNFRDHTIQFVRDLRQEQNSNVNGLTKTEVLAGLGDDATALTKLINDLQTLLLSLP